MVIDILPHLKMKQEFPWLTSEQVVRYIKNGGETSSYFTELDKKRIISEAISHLSGKELDATQDLLERVFSVWDE